MFSNFVRARDLWQCQNCFRQFLTPEQNEGRTPANLHCSHFYTRGNKSVRWDPENADAMCAMCHKYWESHRTEYEEWKLEQLGEKAYNLLAVRAVSTGRDDEAMARLYVAKLIEELETNTNIKVP